MAWDDKTPSLVTRTRLFNSSPETVYQELKEYAVYPKRSPLSVATMMELEQEPSLSQ